MVSIRYSVSVIPLVRWPLLLCWQYCEPLQQWPVTARQSHHTLPSELSSDQTSGQRNTLGIFRSQGSGVTISIVEIPFVIPYFLALIFWLNLLEDSKSRYMKVQRIHLLLYCSCHSRKGKKVRMAVLVLKRTSDKLDTVLSALVFFLGLTVFCVYLSAPRWICPHILINLHLPHLRLSCVPLGCVGRPYTANCARDWVFLR